MHKLDGRLRKDLDRKGDFSRVHLITLFAQSPKTAGR